ncbi:helix-turn-helix transcriptional regulator [Oceanobacillus kimchii]|uniref:helix-turn-helix transcriptional regulator n=1 Tax=Oceanobacillus TaxID=182709 RepID=UPI0003483A9D|nr:MULTISPECIES: helix-turn-helix transcriptional regulator [Oceanobacillus]MBT2599800.1 helix-turn-helix transcriptional regulator [Oceanobacillus sp. ISL-74]MCT1576981.1 helix-turn-helix transcriptional regulator [Oceanobacillus kimchii]MCT2135051.1 helix-turn-helix transcriptional regulator [Oceanobacillus kimchii]
MSNNSPHIRNKIHVLRAEKRMTQQALAKEVGASRQTIIAIEKERYTPSLLLAFQIAHVFDVSITEVFEFQLGED